MEAGRPSATAFRAALVRARHQVHDRPTVIHDPIAIRIVGGEHAAAIRSGAPENRVSRAMRGGIVARSRIAEDALHAAVKHDGVTQYVVLGAGLDTFAYRNPYPAQALRVFEVDHPDTQAWKRRLLHDAQVEVPPSVSFAPIDFERQALPDVLGACGFEANRPSFFSWLGVTYYVRREAVLGTLKHIASTSPRGSTVVFDCLYRPSRMDLPGRFLLHRLSRRFARMGEPWVTWFERAGLAGELRALGFSRVEQVSTREMNERVFAERGDGLRVRGGGLGGLVVARV